MDYLLQNGVSNAEASGIMTALEWTRHKNGGTGEAGYDTYSDYLTDHVGKLMSEYGSTAEEQSKGWTDPIDFQREEREKEQQRQEEEKYASIDTSTPTATQQTTDTTFNAAFSRSGLDRDTYDDHVRNTHRARSGETGIRQELYQLEQQDSGLNREMFSLAPAASTGMADTDTQTRMNEILNSLNADSKRKKELKDQLSAITSAENYIDTSWDRWVELASLGRALTGPEREEAKAAVKALGGAEGELRGFLAQGSDADKQTANEYGALSAVLQNRTSSGNAVAAGAMTEVPFVQQAMERSQKATLDGPYLDAVYQNEPLKEVLKQNNVLEDARNANPAAYTLGKVGMNIGLLTGASEAVNGITGAMEGFSVLPEAAQSAIQSGATFSLLTGLQEAGNIKTKEEWDEAENEKAERAAEAGQIYAPRDYSFWSQVGDVLKDSAVSFAAGAGGGALSSAFEAGGVTLLGALNLSDSFPAQLANQGLAGMAFAGGNVAVRYLLDQNYRPTPQDVASDLISAGIFRAMGGISRAKILSENSAARTDDAITAAKQTEYFSNVKTREDLKTAYRDLARANHPDVGGSKEIMQKINAEHAALENILPSAESGGTAARGILTRLNAWLSNLLSSPSTPRNEAAKTSVSIAILDMEGAPTAAAVQWAPGELAKLQEVPVNGIGEQEGNRAWLQNSSAGMETAPAEAGSGMETGRDAGAAGLSAVPALTARTGGARPALEPAARQTETQSDWERYEAILQQARGGILEQLLNGNGEYAYSNGFDLLVKRNYEDGTYYVNVLDENGNTLDGAGGFRYRTNALIKGADLLAKIATAAARGLPRGFVSMPEGPTPQPLFIRVPEQSAAPAGGGNPLPADSTSPLDPARKKGYDEEEILNQERPENATEGAGDVSLKPIRTGNLKVVETKAPEVANNEWRAKGYDKPPYDPSYKVNIVQAGSESYVRVFSYNTDGTSNKLGGWIMLKSDIEGLTPAQIADKFALPKEPTHVCDVIVRPEYELQTGIANRVKEWGKGGGQQFDTIGKRLPRSSFVNERKIGE